MPDNAEGFIEQGGIGERMMRSRLEKSRQDKPPET